MSPDEYKEMLSEEFDIDIGVDCDYCMDTKEVFNGKDYEKCPHCNIEDEDRVQSQ